MRHLTLDIDESREEREGLREIAKSYGQKAMGQTFVLACVSSATIQIASNIIVS